MKTAGSGHHQRLLFTLTVAGLTATGIGFLGASADPGRGPLTVHGSLTIGGLYLPPLLVGLVNLALAGLTVARIRFIPTVGAVLAIILLAGSATLGAAAVSYRLIHPGQIIGFAEDWLQILGETTAAVAGFTATMQLLRSRRPHDRAAKSSTHNQPPSSPNPR